MQFVTHVANCDRLASYFFRRWNDNLRGLSNKAAQDRVILSNWKLHAEIGIEWGLAFFYRLLHKFFQSIFLCFHLITVIEWIFLFWVKVQPCNYSTSLADIVVTASILAPVVAIEDAHGVFASITGNFFARLHFSTFFVEASKRTVTHTNSVTFWTNF